MLLLVSGATDTVRRYSYHPHLGRLLTPNTGNSIMGMADCGLPWAADNSCFNGLSPSLYLKMLDGIARQDTTRLLWVTVPDVVGNHLVTVEFFKAWSPELYSRRLPVAFVAQDGATLEGIPWDAIDCLFIGGSTRWKMSKYAQRLMVWAKAKDKLVHAGRVNSDTRMDWMGALQSSGADSFDGSKYSMFPDTWIPPTLDRLAVGSQMGIRGVILNA